MSAGERFRRSLAMMSSSTNRFPIQRKARITSALVGFRVDTNLGDTWRSRRWPFPRLTERLRPVVRSMGRIGT